MKKLLNKKANDANSELADAIFKLKKRSRCPKEKTSERDGLNPEYTNPHYQVTIVFAMAKILVYGSW